MHVIIWPRHLIMAHVVAIFSNAYGKSIVKLFATTANNKKYLAAKLMILLFVIQKKNAIKERIGNTGLCLKIRKFSTGQHFFFIFF